MSVQVQKPDLVLVGPKAVTINGEIYYLKKMVEEYDNDEEPIIEAKLRVFVAENIALEEFYQYLKPYMEFEVWRIRISSGDRDLRMPMYKESELLNKQIEIVPQLSWLYTSDVKDYVKEKHPLLQDVWTELNSWNNILKHPLIDAVTEMVLVSPDMGTPRRTIVLGCGDADCQPTLQSATEQEDWNRFIDFFTALDKEVKASICYKNLQKHKKYKSQESIVVGEEIEPSGWQCART